MRLDCLAVCNSQHPAQVERNTCFKQPKLSPTFKARGPFKVWCIDLMTKLSPMGPRGESTCIVAVCPFSKFVLADALTDKSSESTMRWFALRVVSFFGVPMAVRVDQGTEFKGRFQRLCEYLGVQVRAVYTSHPQANGLVERYNGCIKQGLRKLASIHPTVAWTELLPTVLAGLRFLPTKLGLAPAWVAFKQEVQGLPAREGSCPEGDEIWEEAHLDLQSQLIKEQLAWWDVASAEVKARLDKADKQMA